MKNNKKILADLSKKYQNIQYAYNHGMELLVKVATKNLLALSGNVMFNQVLILDSLPVVGISMLGEDIFINLKYGESINWADSLLTDQQRIQIYQETFNTKIYEKINYHRN